MEKETERSGFFKIEEGVILNKDSAALQKYKLQKQKFRELNNLKEDVDFLKQETTEIKDLLKQLILINAKQ